MPMYSNIYNIGIVWCPKHPHMRILAISEYQDIPNIEIVGYSDDCDMCILGHLQHFNAWLLWNVQLLNDGLLIYSGVWIFGCCNIRIFTILPFINFSVLIYSQYSDVGILGHVNIVNVWIFACPNDWIFDIFVQCNIGNISILGSLNITTLTCATVYDSGH